MNKQIKISRFDQVRLLSTKNIKYLSAPPGTKIDPHGTWSVAAVVGDELLLVKNNVVVKVPVPDVLRIASYDISHLLSRLGRLSRGKKTGEDES
jgi:hypothetical protein